MEQHIVIAILFLAALAYLGHMMFKNFTSSECQSGCGSCGVDFKKIRKDIQEELQKKAVK